jgi:hypothetical protein
LVAAIWNSQEEGAARQRGPLSCRASVRAIRRKLTGSRPSTAESTGWVHEEGDNLVFDYIMDMEDATWTWKTRQVRSFLKGLARFAPKAIQ